MRRYEISDANWQRIFAALQDPDLEQLMLDATIVRAHQHAAGPKKSTAEALGRSRGGLSSKLHGSVDAAGKPVGFRLTPGQQSEITQAEGLLGAHRPGVLIADKAYDSDAFVGTVRETEAEVVIPPRRNRKAPRDIDRNLYKDRNKIERFFGRIKHYRRIATRYDKTARNYLAFIYLVSIVTLLL